MITDRQLTELQETGLAWIESRSTVAEITVALDQLGLRQDKVVVISGDGRAIGLGVKPR